MFGAFKSTATLLGGLLWKVPWRMSRPQKQRQRKRLQNVDNVLNQLNLGLHIRRRKLSGISYDVAIKEKKLLKPRVMQLRLLNKASFFPTERQMSYKDKYTIFNRYSKDYRKGIHKVPKWTKISNRRNPKNF